MYVCVVFFMCSCVLVCKVYFLTDALLPRVVEFIKQFAEYPDTIGSWQGKPRSLSGNICMLQWAVQEICLRLDLYWVCINQI